MRCILRLLIVLVYMSVTPIQAQDSLQGKPYVSLKFGALGFGLEFSKPISNRLSLRLQSSYFAKKIIQNTTEGSLITQRMTGVQLGGVGLTSDINLSATNPNWKFCLGVFYQWNKLNETRAYTYQSPDLTEDLGSLSLTFTAFPVNPYLGFMVGNFKSKKRVQFSLELGTLYHGAPRVAFTGTGRIAQTAEQVDKVKSNVRNYMFYPIGNLNIRFRLGK